MADTLRKYLPALLIIILACTHRLATIPEIRSLSSDAANISSFAIGLEYGHYFEDDPVMSDKRLYRWYTPAYVFLIRKLAGFFGGDYHLAFWSQVDVLMISFMLGCYLLGRDFLGSRKYGILLMLISLPFIKLPIGDGWGISDKIRPTVFFVSYLPLLLWFFWRSAGKGVSRYIAYFFIGLSFYVHPVSAPLWIVALWLAGWLLFDEGTALKVRMKSQALSLLVLGTTIAPYTLVYTGRYGNLVRHSLPYEKLMEISRFRFNRLAFEPFNVPLESFKGFPFFLKLLILMSPIILALLYLKKGGFRQKSMILLAWLFSLFVVSSLIPAIEHSICYKFKKFPFEIDLERNYIFLPFMLYMSFLLFASYLEGILIKRKRLRKLLSFLIILMVLFWWGNYYGRERIGPIIGAWSRGELYLRPETGPRNFSAALIKATTTPNESICHVPGDMNSLFVRFDAKRPLVYTFKDGGVLTYAGSAGLVDWYSKARGERSLLKSLQEDLPPQQKGEMLLDWARCLGADCLLISESVGSLKAYFIDNETIQCHGSILVRLEPSKDSEDRTAETISPDRFPPSPSINLLDRPSLPSWIAAAWEDNYRQDEDKILTIRVEGDSKSLRYKLVAEPGDIFLLTLSIKYQQDAPGFSCSLGSWKAPLYGQRTFEEKNDLLAGPDRWKDHKLLVFIPPEIDRRVAKIDWNALTAAGRGRVSIRKAILRYLGRFPLADGIYSR